MGGVMDGYIRVSQVAGRSGERFQSPDQQRESIAAWATANGVRIAAWHEDLDQSGGTMDRPGMNAILRRVDAGQTSGIVVARLDRFARTVIGGLTTIQQLHERGARVVSVGEAIDHATPMGRAMLGLLLIMAEWQRDQADEHLAAAQHRAASAGRFPGKTPFGYRRTTEGLTEVDPDAARFVRRMFEMRADGAGWNAIALALKGVPTPQGRARWAPTTIQGMIRSEAPLGVFTGPRGLRIEGAWPPIVDQSLWDRANAVHGFRDTARNYDDRLLAGVARCANCRHVMVRQVNHHGFVSYGCPHKGCEQRASIGAELLDSYVCGPVNARLRAIRLAPHPANEIETARLVTARDAATDELEAWRDDLTLRQALGDADWRAGMIARAKARDDAEVALAQHRGTTGTLEDLPAEFVADLGELPWSVQRRVVETLLHSVWVRKTGLRGTAARRHVDRRVLVVWADDARPPELPRRNGAGLPPLTW